MLLVCSAALPTRTPRAHSLECFRRYVACHTIAPSTASRSNPHTIAPPRAALHHCTCCRTHSSLTVHLTCHPSAVAPPLPPVPPAPSTIPSPVAAPPSTSHQLRRRLCTPRLSVRLFACQGCRTTFVLAVHPTHHPPIVAPPLPAAPPAPTPTTSPADALSRQPPPAASPITHSTPLLPPPRLPGQPSSAAAPHAHMGPHPLDRALHSARARDRSLPPAGLVPQPSFSFDGKVTSHRAPGSEPAPTHLPFAVPSALPSPPPPPFRYGPPDRDLSCLLGPPTPPPRHCHCTSGTSSSSHPP